MLEAILRKLDEKPKTKKFTLMVIIGFSLYGLQEAAFSLYKNYNELMAPSNVLAIIKSADFQDPEYDRISVNLRNPTNEDSSINNFTFFCERYKGKNNFLNVANNHAIFKKLKPVLNLMPININKGESKVVDIYIAKTKDSLTVNQACKSITPIWTDTSLKQQKGAVTKLFKDSVYLSFTN